MSPNSKELQDSRLRYANSFELLQRAQRIYEADRKAYHELRAKLRTQSPDTGTEP